MWRLAKLSNTEFKALEKIIGEFNNDIAKLSLIQQSGQSPLIIARIRGSLKHDVFFTPNTFEILSDIESDLAQFNVSAIDQPHDIGNSNNFTLLYGDRASYNSITTKNQYGLF